MTLALRCGGPGTLSADMYRLTADQPIAAPIFAKAAELLGGDPRHPEALEIEAGFGANRIAQILVVTASLALHACLSPALPERLIAAGYSVGEMAAWSIAGIWSASDTLDLCARRAAAMDQAGGSHGRLAYVRGLERNRVTDLAAHYGCALAIANPDALMVVGGDEADIAAFCQAADASGAVRSAPLDVHIASHTPFLSAAVPHVEEALRSVPIAPAHPHVALFNGGSAARIFDPRHGVVDLAADVARPIEWAATLEAVIELRPDTVLDLGPGHALADMMRGLAPAVRTRAADDFRTLDGLRTWLRSA